MGAKTWMLVHSDSDIREVLSSKPELDRGAAIEYASRLFPGESLTPLEDGELYFTSPPDDEIYVGRYGDVSIIAAKEFAVDYPSRLSQHFISSTGNTVTHAMHSVVDWFAFAQWSNGNLVRSLSLSPDSGILEDFGEHLEFERPFWDGHHPAVDEDEEEDGYPFVFHPLELGEAALLQFFGYQIEGYIEQNLIQPEDYPLVHLKRSKSQQGERPWWKLW